MERPEISSPSVTRRARDDGASSSSSSSSAASMRSVPEPRDRRDATSPQPRMNIGDVDDNAGDGSYSDDLSLLERFDAKARDVFHAHVLSRLDGGDLAMLALVSRSMRAVVFDRFVFNTPLGDLKGVAAVRRELGRMSNFVGSVSRLAWAKERGCPWDARTCAHAAWKGHLEVLQWARANGPPWDEWTCAYAAWKRPPGGAAVGARERLPVEREDLLLSRVRRSPRGAAVERANGCPWDEWTCKDAAQDGHLEVLQWARANGAPWDAMTCRDAALGGHLEVLQWARANGCPWDEMTCTYAAKDGHLEVLQWARANGAPWDENTCAKPRKAATWRCCSGRARTALRGTRGLAAQPRKAATWRCCSGRARTAARGTR